MLPSPGRSWAPSGGPGAQCTSGAGRNGAGRGCRRSTARQGADSRQPSPDARTGRRHNAVAAAARPLWSLPSSRAKSPDCGSSGWRRPDGRRRFDPSVSPWWVADGRQGRSIVDQDVRRCAARTPRLPAARPAATRCPAPCRSLSDPGVRDAAGNSALRQPGASCPLGRPRRGDSSRCWQPRPVTKSRTSSQIRLA